MPTYTYISLIVYKLRCVRVPIIYNSVQITYQRYSSYRLTEVELDFNFEVTWQMEHVRLKTKIPMASLVFENFYFDYYTYRFGLRFRLGFGLGLELGLRLGLGLRVSFFRLYFKMSALMEDSPSLFLLT